MLKLRSVFRCSFRRMSGGGNRLGGELSPYLRQHKDNPVHWFPWGEEAIQRAKSEDKMIFLSIGYSTCHWCHVMERESFESQQVAEVMNRLYINVKVDREERPDVDKVYMTFVQATTGGGGWPLSVFLSPDLQPLYGGTYFPPTSSHGRPGFKQILEALASKWQDNKEDMKEAGAEVITILEEKLGGGSCQPGPLPPPSAFHKFYAQLSKNFDPEFGGYSRAPKFPQPSNLLTMFKLHCWEGESEDRRRRELEMNLHTLDMMNKGGIHDHISQGFARYSTDNKWHVPHFEKMLYDQAQLAVVYSTAVQLTGSAVYRDTVQDILTYVSRDLTHTSGGFFTAEDADSYPVEGAGEKKEGAFCVWTMEELKELLNETVPGTTTSLAEVLVHRFNVKDGGNVDPRLDPHGELRNKNVLTTIPEKDPIIDRELYNAAVEKGRRILFQERLKRPRPALDNKILCSSNGLMISGFCRAGSALVRDDYIQTAARAGQFIMDHMFDEKNNRLLRSVYGGKPELEQLNIPIPGFIDDYAFAVQGMLDLYEATFDTQWLEFAVKLQGIQDTKFLDTEKGGYFATEAGDNQIVLRLKDDHDGAEPSSNSISALNLLRLSKLLHNQQYRSQAEDIFKLFSSRLQQVPVSMPALVDAYLFYTQDSPVLVLDCRDSSLVSAVRSSFLPSVVLVGSTGCSHPLLQPLLQGLELESGGVLIKPGLPPVPVANIQQIKDQLKLLSNL